MRSIRIGIPSGKVKMVMFEGTEDELSAEISKLMRQDADLSEKHLNDLPRVIG